MTLHCPFCHADEQERVLAYGEEGKPVLLLLFDCPFFLRVEPSNLSTDENAQQYLSDWRKELGEEWLESMGPLLRARELRNIQRFEEATLPRKSS